MLHITIPKQEYWDESKEEFVYYNDECKLVLEHSLVSISKWEAKWEKPFLTKEQKSSEEMLDYIKCMTLTQNVREGTYARLSNQNLAEINNYINASRTATWFNNEGRQILNNREQITSELIYYWMIALEIPFECQKWHLNRLLTLIEVCNIKNQKPKPRSRREIMRSNAKLNAMNRKRFNTKG